MRSTTATYRQIIASGNTRKFLVTINMTLADSTSLTITEADIMQSSFKILTASSGNDSFDIGSAVIGKCAFTLNNYDERFTEYDFFNATAVVWVGLDGDTTNNQQNYNRIGFYTVDTPQYAGSLVSLELLDNMWKFDVPLSEVNLTFPIDAVTAVNEVCTYCGVTLATQNFHGSAFRLPIAPENDMNCREFIQYVAMIGCNFCDIDSQGNLRIRWYATPATPSATLNGGSFDTDTTPYSDGDSADGGDFTTYMGGTSYDGGSFVDNGVVSFTRLMSRTVGTDEITISGVKMKVGDTDHLIGLNGYVIELENPLVTDSTVNAVLNLIWDVLEDFKLRTFNITALPDVAPEVGDYCAISYKGSMVYSYITNYTFTPSLTTASLGAVTPTQTLTKRYSQAVRNAVDEARKVTDKAISDYDLAVQLMNDLAVNAMGGYEDYEDLPTGGRVWYLSNKPITKVNNHCSFESGSTVFKKTGDGFFVSIDGGQTWQNGYNAQTGQLVVNVLNAIGISAEWIKTGILDVGGSGTNATIRVKDAQNNVICTINQDGITMRKGVIQSADYSYTSGYYSDSGMIIDLINTFMRATAFELHNDGGHIGVAEFDEDSLQVVGDIELHNGSGTFEFKPTDYYIATDFKLLLQTTSGTSTVSVYLHESSSETLIGTYTATTEGVETTTLDHTVGAEADEYYKIVCSDPCKVSIVHAYLAYMGLDGFKGIFEGIVRGYLNATRGNLGKVYFDGNGDFDVSQTGRFRIENNINRVAVTVPSSGTPNLYRYTSGGTEDYAVWNSEFFSKVSTSFSPTGAGMKIYVPQGGSTIQYGLDVMKYDTDNVIAGTTPLSTGNLILIYE